MAILICAPDRANESLARDLAGHLPGVDVRIWPEVGESGDIDFAVLWKHPPGLVNSLPNLKAISSLGAGIEHLVNDPTIPPSLPVGRLAGPRLSEDMAAWLVGHIIADWRDFARFHDQQSDHNWHPWAPSRPARVGILGLGHMGQTTARALVTLGFDVMGWRRDGGELDGVSVYRGQTGLTQLAAQADYLVCLLPLTPQTRGILNADLMGHLPLDSVLINVGRGAHLVEDDLLEALQHRRPGRAILDVFNTEPLPADHPFWSHPNITVSPHCAALTDPKEAAELLAASYTRVQAHQAPIGQVDLSQGY